MHISYTNCNNYYKTDVVLSLDQKQKHFKPVMREFKVLPGFVIGRCNFNLRYAEDSFESRHGK